jgi:hypothetical protein
VWACASSIITESPMSVCHRYVQARISHSPMAQQPAAPASSSSATKSKAASLAELVSFEEFCRLLNSVQVGLGCSFSIRADAVGSPRLGQEGDSRQVHQEVASVKRRKGSTCSQRHVCRGEQSRRSRSFHA